MYVLKEAETFTGVSLSIHRIAKIEITNTVSVFVNSYANETTEIIAWQEVYNMPDFLLESPILDSAYNWLVSSVGPLPDGSLIADITELDKAKQRWYNNIRTERDKHIWGNALTSFGVINSDEVSIRNVLGATASAMALPSFEVDWRMADNSSVSLNASQMIQMGLELQAHIKACYERSWALKAEIEACEDVEALGAVGIYEGWPSLE